MTTQSKEIEELLRQVHASTIVRRVTFVIFLLVFPFFVWFFEFAKVDILKVSFVVLIFYFLAFILNKAIKKQKNKRKIENLIFLNMILDFSFLGFMFHFGAGLGWIMYFSFVGVLSYVYIILPSKKAFFLNFFAIFLISAIALLEYFDIISHYRPFPIDHYKNFKYVISTLIGLCCFFVSIGITLNYFASNLRKKTEILEKAYKEAQDIKKCLGIRVNARKKELEELAEALDKKILKETKKLQEKIEELEEANREAIKRELRMLELKKEIKKLKEAT